MAVVTSARNTTGRILTSLSQRALANGRHPRWKRLARLAAKVRVHDELTGLLAREEFRRRVEKLLPMHPAGALLLVDIDRLHHVNHALGFEAVDACLVAAARLLERHADDGLVGRYGGDEFVVWLDDARRATSVAETIRLSMQRAFCAERTRTLAKFPDLSATEVLTVSIGAARATAGTTYAALLQRADEALSNAKNAGRNRVLW